MDGYQFEKIVADSLKLVGYSTELTKKSGDFGIDVIAKIENKVIGIQVKHHKGKVCYDAFKEVQQGVKYISAMSIGLLYQIIMDLLNKLKSVQKN